MAKQPFFRSDSFTEIKATGTSTQISNPRHGPKPPLTSGCAEQSLKAGIKISKAVQLSAPQSGTGYSDIQCFTVLGYFSWLCLCILSNHTSVIILNSHREANLLELIHDIFSKKENGNRPPKSFATRILYFQNGFPESVFLAPCFAESFYYSKNNLPGTFSCHTSVHRVEFSFSPFSSSGTSCMPRKANGSTCLAWLFTTSGL